MMRTMTTRFCGDDCCIPNGWRFLPSKFQSAEVGRVKRWTLRRLEHATRLIKSCWSPARQVRRTEHMGDVLRQKGFGPKAVASTPWLGEAVGPFKPFFW